MTFSGPLHSVGSGRLPMPPLVRRRGPVFGRSTVNSLLIMHIVVLADEFAGRTVPWYLSLVALAAMFVPAMRMLSWKLDWQTDTRAEQLIYSLAVVLLGHLLGGLLLNTALPWFGVQRPLDPLPLLVAMDVSIVALWWWRRDRVPPPVQVWTTWVPYSPLDVSLLGLALTCLGLVCAGAIRLNNGADGALTEAGLLCLTVVSAILLLARYQLRPGVIHLCIYVMGLALLLMTSLRGWLITGHDVQREFRLFQAVLNDGSWSISSFRDPYNACISVTVLPTMIHNLTGLSPALVMKLVPPMIFAACPVVVFLIAERFVTRGPAIVGVLTFMAFPTFFSDMPFLTRQQYAFTFLAGSFLAATNLRFSVPRRRVVFMVFGLGVLLSHYSTNYVLIGVLGIGLVIHGVLRAADRLLPRRMGWLNRYAPRRGARVRDVRFVLNSVSVVVLFSATLVWSQVLTGTNGQLVRTVTSSLTEMIRPGSQDARSSDTRYNLFGGAKVSPQERLDAYRKETISRTAQPRAEGIFYPLDRVAAVPTTVAPLADVPMTPIGDRLDSAGIDVHTVNSVLRAVIARLLQVFVVIGMVAVVFGYRRRVRASPELTILAGASFLIVLTQVLLPKLSVDYGVLRAFQQSLFLLAPFLSIGMIITLSFLRRAAAPAAGGFALLSLLSLTGALPQFTGGYPAQLHLNNAGQYYDIYYTHPAEVRAADWMLTHVAEEGLNVDGNVETERFTFNRIQSFTRLETAGEIYPTLLRTNAYTLLGTATVTKREASVAHEGDVIAYHYPFSLLSTLKSQVYSNGFATVSR